MRRTARGFTLIELMIVLVVAAIIISIAIPTYNAQMRKSRRSDALVALQQLALLQEQFRANNPLYGTTLAAINGTAVGTLTHYTVTITFDGGLGNNGSNFILTATAKSGDDQNNDRGAGSVTCTPLVLTSLNGSSSKSPTACWQ